MAKESGLGASVTIDDSGGSGRDISNDITNFSISTPQGLQDITGVDKSAMERLILLSDGSFSLTGVFNDASNMIFDVFKTRTGTRTVVMVHSGQTLSMEMLIGPLDLTRAPDGSFVFTTTLSLQDGTVPVWS